MYNIYSPNYKNIITEYDKLSFSDRSHIKNLSNEILFVQSTAKLFKSVEKWGFTWFYDLSNKWNYQKNDLFIRVFFINLFIDNFLIKELEYSEEVLEKYNLLLENNEVEFTNNKIFSLKEWKYLLKEIKSSLEKDWGEINKVFWRDIKKDLETQLETHWEKWIIDELNYSNKYLKHIFYVKNNLKEFIKKLNISDEILKKDSLLKYWNLIIIISNKIEFYYKWNYFESESDLYRLFFKKIIKNNNKILFNKFVEKINQDLPKMKKINDKKLKDTKSKIINEIFIQKLEIDKNIANKILNYNKENWEFSLNS